MKIGQLSLKTRSPVAKRLHESTGLAPAEMHGILGGHCLAGTVAAALNACLTEPRDQHELAVAIAAAGVADVRDTVRALYGAASAPVNPAGSEGTDGEAKA